MARFHPMSGSTVLVAALACLSWVPFAGAQSVASDFTTGYRYDIGGRLTGTILPDPDAAGPLKHLASRSTYNSAGLLIAQEEGELASWQPETVAPANWSSFTVFKLVESSYDSAGRKLWERTSAGGVAYALTQFSYDAIGRLECTAVRMNPATFAAFSVPACSLGTQGPDGPDRITRTTYDARDLPLAVQNAYGTSKQQTTVTFTYGTGRMPETVTDANGNKHQTDFNGFDQLKRWTFPSATTPGQLNSADYLEYTYDENGNRRSLRRRDGRVIVYDYDDLNRVIFKDVPGGIAADVYYNYDLQDLMLDARFQASTGRGIHNVFDGFGRLKSSTINLDDPAWTVTSDYDANGNRWRVTHPDGHNFQYAYDGIDRMISITENGAAALASQTYDTHGNRWQLIRGAGVGTTTFAYDALSRLQSLTHDVDGAATTNDVSFNFSSYNAASQLRARTTSNAAYDFVTALNNSRSYASNGLNQYSSVAGTALGWTTDGNLASDGATTFGYDIDNRLISASGAKNTTLTYDPLGRLYQDSSSSTRFVYEGTDLIAEYDAAGLVSNRYVHGSGADEPLVWYQGQDVAASTRRYVYSDFQGSTVALTGSTGATLGIYKYDAYGTPNSTNGTFRFQYTGQALLPSLGLSYYKARFYNAALGRFVQTDPIGFQDGLNLYSYAANDPVNRVDPSGLRNCPPGDRDCVETPESERKPDTPQPPTAAQKVLETVVVTAYKLGKDSNGAAIPLQSKKETYYTADPQKMLPRAMQMTTVKCTKTLSVDVGRPGSLAAGQAGAHTHGSGHEQTPGPGDNIAALGSTASVAFVMTGTNVFMVRAFANGTYATNNVSGPPLTSGMRSSLVDHMRGWEGPKVNNPNLTDKQRFCP